MRTCGPSPVCRYESHGSHILEALEVSQAREPAGYLVAWICAPSRFFSELSSFLVWASQEAGSSQFFEILLEFNKRLIVSLFRHLQTRIMKTDIHVVEESMSCYNLLPFKFHFRCTEYNALTSFGFRAPSRQRRVPPLEVSKMSGYEGEGRGHAE